MHVAGPSPLRLAWKTHYVGHLRAVNNNFLDTYQLKSQNAVLDGSMLPGKVFDLELPFSEIAEAYAAMDERRAVKVLLRP